MTLKNLQAILVPQIETALIDFFNSLDFGASPELGEMLRYHMGWEPDVPGSASKGKRLRPLITLLATGGFNEYPPASMPAAIAVELLHNFTLIHDDIEDQSPLRHGRPTLWQRYGTAQAVNAGDALFSIAQLSMLNLAETSSQMVALDALREFNHSYLHLAQGQYLDISFEDKTDVAIPTYMEMVAGKTGALIAFAASLGARVTGQTLTEHHKLAEYGHYLGLAFQIQDDILGIWGDPTITGKSAASDILTRKKSLPNLIGLAECPEFRSLWQKETLADDEVLKMAGLLENCGVREKVNQQSEELTQLALQSLKTVFPKKNDYSEALSELAGSLLSRNY